jgi:hypothetical protein
LRSGYQLEQEFVYTLGAHVANSALSLFFALSTTRCAPGDVRQSAVLVAVADPENIIATSNMGMSFMSFFLVYSSQPENRQEERYRALML